MPSSTIPNTKQDGVQDLRTKLIVYMSFYVEARDARDAQEMVKWVDKLEQLLSDTVNKVLDEATKEIRGHISAASENQRYHEENTKNERLAREYKGANDGLILAESAIEKVRRRWK